MVKEWLSRLRFLVTRKPLVDLDEELRFHVEREKEAYIAEGMSRAEAQRRAAIAFGGMERARHQCVEEHPAWLWSSLLRDLRYGIRGLWRNPGFTVVSVLTLALGIGANTTIFSLLDQALLRALPVADPQRLVVLSFAGSNPGHTQSDGGDTPGRRHEFSYPMYRDLRDRNDVLSGIIAEFPATVGVTWQNHSESVAAELVSGNYFQILGVSPALGRLLVAGDETAAGANPVAVLSFDFWKTHLNEAPVAGATLLINGTAFTITGVAAPGFHSMAWGHMPDVYVPITMQKTIEPEWSYLADHQSYWLTLAGRLRPGVTANQAAAVPLSEDGGVPRPARPVCTNAPAVCRQGAPQRGVGGSRFFAFADNYPDTFDDHHGHGVARDWNGHRQRGQSSAGTRGIAGSRVFIAICPGRNRCADDAAADGGGHATGRCRFGHWIDAGARRSSRADWLDGCVCGAVRLFRIA